MEPQQQSEFRMPPSQPERGGCLTAMLILMMIASGITALVYIAMPDFIIKMNRKQGIRIPEWAPYVLAIFSFIQIGLAYMTYQWKKIGVIGLVVMAAIALIFNLYIGLGPMSFTGLIGIILLIILVNPVWKHFK